MVALCVAFQRRNGREGRGGGRDRIGAGTAALGGAADIDVGGGGGVVLMLQAELQRLHEVAMAHADSEKKVHFSPFIPKHSRSLCVHVLLCTSLA
jgi:hypothetical protein